MKIIIAGDLVPTNSNIGIFEKGDVNALLGEELLSIWNSSDLRLLNLEVPLTDIESPISKSGPNLIAPLNTIKGIKALNPSLITLANNHILDQGIQGLKSTMETLKKYDIPFVGVGDNLLESSKSYIIEEKGKKIGVYACAENEFSIATLDKPGANPFDPFESLDHIEELKSKSDYVIVLYHGGKEHYRYPSPYLQKACKKMVDKGADFVICQHSHAVGSFEKHKDSTIVYGQGNFIFDLADNEYWNNGLLIKVSIDEEVSIDYIPIIKNENTIKLAIGKDMEKILSDFNKRSKDILEEGFIKENYAEFAEKNIVNYLTKLSGFGKWKSRIDRHLLNNWMLKRRYSKKNLLAIENYIKCEAHNELLLEGIKKLIKNK